MKNKGSLFLIIGAVLLLGIVVSSIVGVSRAMKDIDNMVVVKKDKGNSSSSDNGAGSNTGDDTQIDSDSPSQEEVTPVSFTMRSEPEFAFSNDPESSYTGIRFVTDLPLTLAKNIEENSNYTAYTLIAPLDYFEQVYDSSADVMDWVGAFESAGLAFVKKEASIKYEFTDGKVNSVLSVVLTDVKYSNTNRKFTAVSFTEKVVDGSNVVRVYAGYEEGQNHETIARSLAYVAIDSYNRMSVGGAVNENYEELLAISKVTNNSVDLTNGQTAETENDGSDYILTNFSASASVTIDQETTLTWTTSPNAEVPILWYSENAAIATVENGVVKGVNPGTTKIVAVLCGIAYRCDVTVK